MQAKIGKFHDIDFFRSCALLAHLMSHDVTCLLLTLLTAAEQVSLSPVKLNMHEQYIIHPITQVKLVTRFENNAKIVHIKHVSLV